MFLNQMVGGWLDVQEALWNCYRARKCQYKWKQIRSKFIPWYESLWRGDIPGIRCGFFDIREREMVPSLVTVFPKNDEIKFLNELTKKQKTCFKLISEVYKLGYDYFNNKKDKQKPTWDWKDFNGISITKDSLQHFCTEAKYGQNLGLSQTQAEVLQQMVVMIDDVHQVPSHK